MWLSYLHSFGKPVRPWFMVRKLQMALKKWNTYFHLEYSAFHMFCCSQKFSTGTTQKGAFYLLSNQNLWKLLVNGKQPQKQLRIEVHQSQSMTFATRLSKHLFPKRSAKMITPSNNKIFGEWLSPLVWIVQNFSTSVGFDSSQPRHKHYSAWFYTNIMIPKIYIVLLYIL